jgi:hypothetical protein
VRSALTVAPRLGPIAPEMGKRARSRSAGSGTASALFGKTRRAVLALLFAREDGSLYVREIALRDGRLDGRVARGRPAECPGCGEDRPPRPPICLYCGEPVATAPFE